jgi:hypothetical protein
MLRIQCDAIRERLGTLYDAMKDIGEVKTLQDKYDVFLVVAE